MRPRALACCGHRDPFFVCRPQMMQGRVGIGRGLAKGWCMIVVSDHLPDEDGGFVVEGSLLRNGVGVEK